MYQNYPLALNYKLGSPKLKVHVFWDTQYIHVETRWVQISMGRKWKKHFHDKLRG